MADQRNIFEGEDLSEGEVDDLLSGFNDMVKNPNICSLEEIDISKPGWEVVLHFDDSDPRQPDSLAARDLWRLEEWSAIGLFEITVQHSPHTVVNLKYDENCLSKKFSPDQLVIFNKYRPSASALQSGRRLPDADTKEKVETVLADVQIESVEAVVEQEIEVNLEDEDVVLIDLDLYRKILELDFEVLVLKFSADIEDQQTALDKLKQIAEDEELNIEIEDFEFVEIYISKKEGVLYQKSMDMQNFEYLKKFDFNLV